MTRRVTVTALVLLAGLVLAPGSAAHERGKAEPRIAAAVTGRGFERLLTVRLRDADDGDPVPGADVTAAPGMTEPHIMELAPVPVPNVHAGVYRAPLRFIMPGRWTVRIAVGGPKVVSADASLPVTVAAGAAAAIQPPALVPLPVRIKDTLHGQDVLSIAVLWIHAISAGLWMFGVLVMAFALTARPAVLASDARAALGRWYRRRGVWLHWALVPIVVATGIYNLVEVTPFRLVWRPDELSRLADIPYGRLYEGVLLFKLALFVALLISGTQLLLRTVRGRPSAFAPDDGERGFGRRLASALGPPGLLYLTSVPLILLAAAALRYIHVLSHVAEVLQTG
jgi:hypothetical protein